MDLKKIKTFEDLKKYKNEFYGPSGEVFNLKQKLKTVSKEQKKVIGLKLKSLVQEHEDFFKKKSLEIKINEIKSKAAKQYEDVSMIVNPKASLHPFTIIANRFRKWLIQNGYFETEGSEIETEEFNFERLNIPKDHPARDMQDTLYFNENSLLRTHNTGFTAKELLQNKNKAFSHFTIGNVYRNDEDDATHSHQFVQVDLVSVGNLLFNNLIWTLKSLISYVLEEECQIRLRPSYFPFTEPSVEVDVFFKNKWIEVLGAGMINKKVLIKNGYTNDQNGFCSWNWHWSNSNDKIWY